MLRVHNRCRRSRSILCLFPPKLFTHSVLTNTLARAQVLTHTQACSLACVFKCLLLETDRSIHIFLHRTFPLLCFFSFGNGMRLSVFFFFFPFSSPSVANYSRVWSSRSLFNCLFSSSVSSLLWNTKSRCRKICFAETQMHRKYRWLNDEARFQACISVWLPSTLSFEF